MRFRLYHGTRTASLSELLPSGSGEFGPGIYMTDFEPTAQFYAHHVARGPDAPRVAVVEATFENPFEVLKTDWIRMTTRSTPRTVVKRLMEKGHDGIIGIGINGVDRQYIAWDSSQVRVVEENLAGADAEGVCFNCSFGGTDREHVLELFLKAAARVWGERTTETYLRTRVRLHEQTPYEYQGSKVLAALLPEGGKPYAIGDSLIKIPHYALLVSDELLALDDEAIERTLIHEAVHLGYLGHGKDFRDLCRAKGGALSSLGVEGGNTVKVQRKDGSRYKTIKEFDNERDAIAWAKTEMRTTPGKYRLEM